VLIPLPQRHDPQARRRRHLGLRKLESDITSALSGLAWSVGSAGLAHALPLAPPLRAIQAQEEGFRQHTNAMVYMGVERRIRESSPLRSEPRFLSLLRRMGLHPAQ
jgi:hypothetical protein